MLVTLCQWQFLSIGISINLLVTSFVWWRPRLRWKDRGCWWGKRPKLSPTSQNCRQQLTTHFVSIIRHQHRCSRCCTDSLKSILTVVSTFEQLRKTGGSTMLEWTLNSNIPKINKTVNLPFSPEFSTNYQSSFVSHSSDSETNKTLMLI